MAYRLAEHVELVERGGEQFLMSQAPLLLLRLNQPLAALARRCAAGPTLPETEAEEAVLEQLVWKGFMTRLGDALAAETALPTVTVVIPVKDRADELRRCLASLAAVSYPRDLLDVIVVDDGSSDDSAAVARAAGATVIPSGGTGRGPAAARNAGARVATGEILAFIDSDCTAHPAWLAELVPTFADSAIAAVGGIVAGMCDLSAIDRYEAVMSSLSLGGREMRGSTGDDTFYLPSCNLLVRRPAFAACGGFDDAMHVGEDVDLTWRLRDRGWTITYRAAGTVYHEHRSTPRSFMSRRFDYGTSEGTLQALHPRRRKRMVVPPVLGVALALVIGALFGKPVLAGLAAALLLGDAFLLWRSMRRRVPVPFPMVALARVKALGSLAYYLCYHLVRYYSVPLAAASLMAAPVAAAAGFIVIVAAGVDYAVRKPRLAFPAFLGIYLMEQLAYGSGVFWGCLRRRTFRSYRVTLLPRLETAG